MNCSTMTIAVNASNDIIVFQITKCRRLVREAEEKELKAARLLKDVKKQKMGFFRLPPLFHQFLYVLRFGFLENVTAAMFR